MDYDRQNRPQVVGPETPLAPYPVRLESWVIGGFGRGSAELGIPTANIPQESFDSVAGQIQNTGIYFGYAKVGKGDNSIEIPESTRKVDYTFGSDLCTEDERVYPMVMSVGWNPFYGNDRKSAEIHIIHQYKRPFYGAKLKVMLLGYIRPELNYISKEALIEDIKTDVQVALNSLQRPDYEKHEKDEFWADN